MSNTEQQTKEKDAMLKELILKFPKQHKIKLMKDALEEGNIAAYFQLTKILLETPISKGGVSSDEIPHPVNHANKRK